MYNEVVLIFYTILVLYAAILFVFETNVYVLHLCVVSTTLREGIIDLCCSIHNAGELVFVHAMYRFRKVCGRTNSFMEN